MITEEENKKIEEMVLKAIPFGSTCAWTKSYEKDRRENLKKRITDLVEKAKQPFAPTLERHFKPDLEYKNTQP